MQPTPRPASPYAAALAGGLLTAALLLGGAAPDELATCSAGATSRLYLGQSTPSGVLAEAEWRSFVAESVTARFPEGFTELRGHGHWRDGRGALLEEATRIVEIAHADDAAMHARIRAVAADYRVRFAQEAVLITMTRNARCLDTRLAATSPATKVSRGDEADFRTGG